MDFSAVNITGAAVALVAGAALSVGNYFLTLKVWKRDPEKLPSMFALRQFFNIALLVALWFLTPLTPCDRTFVLIGAVIGLTLPTLILTPRILRIPRDNDSGDKGADPQNPNENNRNGKNNESSDSNQDHEKKGGKDQ